MQQQHQDIKKLLQSYQVQAEEHVVSAIAQFAIGFGTKIAKKCQKCYPQITKANLKRVYQVQKGIKALPLQLHYNKQTEQTIKMKQKSQLTSLCNQKGQATIATVALPQHKKPGFFLQANVQISLLEKRQ